MRRKKRGNWLSRNSLKRCSILLIILMMLQNIAWANPLGPKVIKGGATVSGVGTGQVVIQQTTSKAILTWQQFNIAPNEVTRFIQPNRMSIALNRILDANPSKIFGSLQANGSVILLNPNGVMFGPHSQVNVGGLIASSLNLTDQNFLSGHYLFQGQNAAGSVNNTGAIETGPGGFVYLFAPNVKNSGLIKSPEGQIVLAAGTTAYLSERPDGQGFLVAVTAPAGEALNLGDLVADGGNINIYGRVVNQQGLVQANSVREKNGQIELYASEKLILANGSVTSAKGSDQGVSNGGTISVVSDKTQGATQFDLGAVIDISGGAQGGNGGSAEVSGHAVTLGGTVRGAAVSGYQGGKLLLDPYDLTVDQGMFDALSGNGLGSIEFQADHDINVIGVIAFLDSLTVPSGSRGRLVFEAGNDIIITNTLIINDPSLTGGTGGAPWDITATAGRDILLSNSYLGTGLGGNMTLQAGRNIVAPSVFDSLLGLYQGLRLDTDIPGTLTINAGGDFLGGFVLTNGQAHVHAGGNFGAADNYVNLTLGKGQIDVTANGSIYLGLVQDKGLAEGVGGFGNRVVTADPNNSVALTAATGDIHLHPLAQSTGNDSATALLQQYYPASFSAQAPQGNIYIESNLTFWPSPTGSLDFFAQGSIKGIPTQTVSQPHPNCGLQGLPNCNPKRPSNCGLPGPPNCGPNAPPTINISLPIVKLIPADPNTLVGLSGPQLQTLLDMPSQNISADVIPVTFKTATGDISSLNLNFYSPTLRKQATIQSGKDITQLVAIISAPEDVQATVSAAGNIDMTPVGRNGSGLHFYGTGTGFVTTGGNLNLSTSPGIDQKLVIEESNDAVSKGLIEIAVGGNLEMTQSAIVTYNGAAIKIHGLAGPDSPVGGSVNIGTNQGVLPVFGSYQGVLTFRGGDIDIHATGDVNVNTSRVATLGGSDIRIVSDQGDINAGFGGAGDKVAFAFPEVAPDGTTIPRPVYVPGSGIFTFSPLDPLPLPIIHPPFTGFPTMQALYFKLIKMGLLGYNTKKIATQYNDMYQAIRTDFVNTMKLGNIDLQALNGTLVVPKGGIRGKSLTLKAKKLNLQGGSLSGDITIDVGQIIGNPGAINGGQFSGNVGGQFALPTSGSGLVGLSGSTGSLSTSTATTTATVASAAEDAATEETAPDADSRGAERTNAGQKEADTLQGKRHRKMVQNLSFKKGVTIEVNVKDDLEK
jgi:filamentous hemagglutinin family protein